jgi:uncharacterized protein DUF5655
MPAREKAKLRPLWACPRCGQGFVSPNMWHSCLRMTVRDHFQGRPKEVVDLYRRFARMVRELGPGVKPVSVKTGIGFMVRVRFAGVALQKGGLRVSFWLKRRIDSPRFARIELIPPRNFVYSFHVRSPEDLDEEVRGWLREAYRVGTRSTWFRRRPSHVDEFPRVASPAWPRPEH